MVQRPGLEEFFLLWPFSVSCYLSLGFSSKVSSVPVHNSKASVHAAADFQCWFTVRIKNKENPDNKVKQI